MARWVFVGMAVHPEIKDLSNVTNGNREELDRTIAKMFTSLLADKCPIQAKLAIKIDGNSALESAFRTMGELAMREITSNPKVNASFGNFAEYVDKNKLKAFFPTK
jgi:hypothetical protein